MATFENAANGYRESVTILSNVGALLFGTLWFVIQGLWTHVAIQSVVIVLTFSVLSVFAPLVLGPLWLLYALLAPVLLKRQYRRRGWREV